MKRLLILSGKGGTGKTTVAGAFIKMASCLSYADCDVDAPNLHLLLKPTVLAEVTDFLGMTKYEIEQPKCHSCGMCEHVCRFEAIHQRENGYQIDTMACEGCGACEFICPEKAIHPVNIVAGERLLYRSTSLFSTALLKTGGGNSGLLVTEVKNALLHQESVELEIIDGSPGIGCPVIASIKGSDMILLVTEPTLSGISDLTRIVSTAQIFHIPILVCINKVTTETKSVEQILDYCSVHALPMVGMIPYDRTVLTNLNRGLSAIDTDCPAGRAIKNVFAKTLDCLSATWKGKNHAD